MSDDRQEQGERPATRPMPERLTYTVPEAAAAIGISPAHAYRLAKAGRFPTIRFGGRTLVPRVQLERLLAGENASDPIAPGGEADD